MQPEKDLEVSTDKLAKISQLEKLLQEKMSTDMKNRMSIEILSSIICILSKHFIKAQGYSVVRTVLHRELKNLGKEDSQKLLKIFGIEIKTKEDVKDVLRLAAMILGYKLGYFDNSIGLADCPYCEIAKKFDEPFILNACLEYSQGILEGLAGNKFKLVESKKKVKGDPYCKYDVIENV